MAFTAKDVAALREQTGAGMMDCKKALVATDGDMEKAAEYLREQGVNVAAKKASRVASEGAVSAYTSPDGKVGAMVEINCESDFVGKSDVFIELFFICSYRTRVKRAVVDWFDRRLISFYEILFPASFSKGDFTASTVLPFSSDIVAVYMFHQLFSLINE